MHHNPSYLCIHYTPRYPCAQLECPITHLTYLPRPLPLPLSCSMQHMWQLTCVVVPLVSPLSRYIQKHTTTTMIVDHHHPISINVVTPPLLPPPPLHDLPGDICRLWRCGVFTVEHIRHQVRGGGGWVERARSLHCKRCAVRGGGGVRGRGGRVVEEDGVGWVGGVKGQSGGSRMAGTLLTCMHQCLYIQFGAGCTQEGCLLALRPFSLFSTMLCGPHADLTLFAFLPIPRRSLCLVRNSLLLGMHGQHPGKELFQVGVLQVIPCSWAGSMHRGLACSPMCTLIGPLPVRDIDVTKIEP